ncbi:MAG: hypothetical protein K6U12_04605 [Armatimonadetes bacterium]|nr:hypothetical protein [Armatimonadota bacterium]
MRHRWLAVLVFVALSVSFSQQERGIRFGQLNIDFEQLTSVQRRKDKTITLEVRGSVNNPVVIDAPDQNFRMRTLQLQGVLAPDEKGQMRLQSAAAIGRVEFFYERKEPFARLNATANRADYDDKEQKVTLTGDVSADSEDDFYRVRWRNNERVVVYLGEESLRVEAEGKLQGGQRRGEMIITSKQQTAR